MLADDIHRNLPLGKRLADKMTGRILSRAQAELVGASRILEYETRMLFARHCWALQAALNERADAIDAPPPLLDQDVDGLALAALGLAGARPHESKDPQGYADWARVFAVDVRAAAAFVQVAAQEVVAGRYDEDIRVGLGPDQLPGLVKQELKRHEVRPDIASLEEAFAAPAAERQRPEPEL